MVSFSHAISQNTVTILLHASSIELLKAVAIYFRERTSDLEIRWYHRSSDAKPVPPLTKLPTYVPMHMCTYWLSPRGIKPDCNNNNTIAKMKEKKERECKLGIENLRILFVLARIPLSDLVSLIFIMYPLLLLIPRASLIHSSGWFSTYLEVDVIGNRSKCEIIFSKNDGQEQGELLFLFPEKP